MFFFLATLTTSETAVIWGTPMPVTILVVHIEPGPTPTFMASTPAFMSASAASAVATLPAMSWQLKLFLVERTASSTPFECPWAVSMTMTSTPDFNRASMRASLSKDMPTAAPTLSLPCPSLQEFGNFSLFTMSVTVMRPFNLLLASTTGSFSILCLWSISFAFSMDMP